MNAQLKLMRPLAAVLILAVLAVHMMAPQPVARAADEAAASATSGGNIPPVPSELFAQYIKGLKETPQYSLGRAYNPKQVRQAVDKWGYKVQSVISSPFWEWLTFARDVGVRLPNGESARLRQKRGKPIVLEVTREGASSSLYALSASQLNDETLGFETVSSLYIPEPSHIPMERFSAENQGLVDVVKALCRRADLDCSIREDLARPVVLTMNMRGKSVPDCLAVISRTTGWKVTYVLRTGQFFGRIPKAFAVPAMGLGDIGHIEAGADPMDVLKQRLEKTTLPGQRPAVILTAPAGASADESEPAAGASADEAEPAAGRE